MKKTILLFSLIFMVLMSNFALAEENEKKTTESPDATVEETVENNNEEQQTEENVTETEEGETAETDTENVTETEQSETTETEDPQAGNDTGTTEQAPEQGTNEMQQLPNIDLEQADDQSNMTNYIWVGVLGLIIIVLIALYYKG